MTASSGSEPPRLPQPQSRQNTSAVASDDLTHIVSGIDQLTDLFRRRLLDDKVKAQMISELTSRLDTQRLAPICREFILLLDRLDAYHGHDGNTQDFIASVGEEILTILAHYGLEPIESQPMFTSITQRVVDVREADDDTADGTVVEWVRVGYRLNGTVIRPEEVIVARRPAAAAQTTA